MSSQEDLRALNFGWLLRLRWAAVAGQLLVVLLGDHLLHVDLPRLSLVAIILLQAVSNLALTGWRRRIPVIPEWGLALPIALDLVLLTWVLSLTGGETNPLTGLYFVCVALAGVVFQSRWTWALVIMSVLCFGALYLAAVPIEATQYLAEHPHPLKLHLKGMWVSFATCSALTVLIVQHGMRQLSAREQALEQARQAAARREKLASLAALAAGAAHELGTPLSVIALAARELERNLVRPFERDANALNALEDARLIREQVDRCSHILWQMAADAGESAGEHVSPVRVGELLERALGEVEERSRVKVVLWAQVETEQMSAPPRALTHALKGLLKNALQASQPGAEVRLEVRLEGPCFRLEVKDTGHGMTPELLARVGEPFFTTKQPGQGMGLGLFLTRALMEQLGGHFKLTSTPGQGTTATLLLPRSSPALSPLQAR